MCAIIHTIICQKLSAGSLWRCWILILLSSFMPFLWVVRSEQCYEVKEYRVSFFQNLPYSVRRRRSELLLVRKEINRINASLKWLCQPTVSIYRIICLNGICLRIWDMDCMMELWRSVKLQAPTSRSFYLWCLRIHFRRNASQSCMSPPGLSVQGSARLGYHLLHEDSPSAIRFLVTIWFLVLLYC